MDEFGVLTERYGLKPQGKAAPMASSKRPTNVGDSQTATFGTNSGLNPKSSQYGSRSHQHSTFDYGSFLDDRNGVFRSSSNKKTQHFGGLDDGIDDIFGGHTKSNVGNGGSFDYDSMFTGSNKSVSTSSSPHVFVDDTFGGMPGLKTQASPNADHGLSSFASPPKQSVAVDDLLDKIGGLHAKAKFPNGKGSEGLAKKAPDFDDLIPGFGGSSLTNNSRGSTEMNKHRKPTVNSNKPVDASHDDPFLVFETASSTMSSESFLDSLEQISKLNNSKGTRGSSSTSPSLRSPPKPMNVSNSNKVNNSNVSSIDELEEFAMGRVQNNASKRANIHTGEIKPNSVAMANKVNNSSVSSIDELEDFAMGRVKNNATRRANVHNGEIKQNSAATTTKGKGAPTARVNQSNDMDDLESIFSVGSRSSSVPKSRAATMDNAFDHQMENKGRPEVSQRVPSGSSASTKKSSVMTSLDDLSLIFGASPSSEFKEVEGETEERRKTRLGRYQRTQERAAQAVADMNQRDLQTKMEQEERHRIADTADVQIKRWAAGKEGNMRALLSTLQYVLWPECGWQPVSLTDMITSASVKKVYRKAALCIHPDKVQHKGANLEQKYTAEKVFDILKEAWSKFNAEELS